MSRFRLYPTAGQEAVMLNHCAHARFIWNLGLEQRSMWKRGRGSFSYAQQCRELTEARAAAPWLASGACVVQHQALRDLDQAFRNFYAGTHRYPTWRKMGAREGFRVVGRSARQIRKLNTKWSAVNIPKVGWVKFRLTRSIPDARSFRVNLQCGQWHIAFAAIPAPIPPPGTGEIAGIDRGVRVTLAYSDGWVAIAPRPGGVEPIQRRLSRAKRGSNRRKALRRRLAKAHLRNANRRKDWVEKESTRAARSFDLIRVEDLRISNMTRSARGTVERPGANVRQKAGLNRAILGSGWGQFVLRLEQKAPGRVEKVNPAYTSQTCSACGHCEAGNRESQAVFRCRACGYQANADTNAAMNIAAGGAAREVTRASVLGALNRKPQRIHDSVG